MAFPFTRSFFRTIIRLVAAASIAFAGAAHASGPAQDSWWNPSESGWGLGVVQEGATFGFAMYVYDNNSNPTWFQGGGSGTATGNAWSGNVFSFHGPYFGGPFAPAATPTQVGTFTFTLTGTNSATFVYTINGVQVTKTLQRLAAGDTNLTGNTLGSFVARYTGCTNGTVDFNVEDFSAYEITHTGANVSIKLYFQAGAICTYTGTYAQEGRYGRVQGTYTCDNASSGNFTMSEIESTAKGFVARLTGTVTQNTLVCNLSARISGATRAAAGF